MQIDQSKSKADASQWGVMSTKDLHNPEKSVSNEPHRRLGDVILQTLMSATRTTDDVSRQNEELNKTFLAHQESVTNRPQDVDSRLGVAQTPQNYLQTAANQLGGSLKAALIHL